MNEVLTQAWLVPILLGVVWFFIKRSMDAASKDNDHALELIKKLFDENDKQDEVIAKLREEVAVIRFNNSHHN